MQKFTIEALELLNKWLAEPGIISKCYSMFHNYSLLNGMALMFQIQSRGLPVGPCASFAKWKSLGGRVKKGAKALWVNIPCKVAIKDKTDTLIHDKDENDLDKVITCFYWKPCVFTLAQVDGINSKEEPLQIKWDKEKMLKELGIKEIPFDIIDGNTQGYANDKGVAINPIGTHKTRTLIHEVAHYLMHISKKCKTEQAIKEVEAELTSALVGYALGLDGADESRGYVQHWLGSNKLTNKSALRVLACANKILKAGEC